jgi:hypothetical protein
MKVNHVFPDKYLKGAHLGATQILVMVTAVCAEKMRAGPDKPEETNYVLRFNNLNGKTGEITPLPFLENVPGLGHGLVLSKPKAESIAEAIGTDEMDYWVGKRVVLYATKRMKGREEQYPIRARAPRSQPAQPAPAPSSTPETDHQQGDNQHE